MYVFEGKPPELKIDQLKQRREKRDEADKELAAAKEAGDQEAIEKYSKRTTKVIHARALWNTLACSSVMQRLMIAMLTPQHHIPFQSCMHHAYMLAAAM